MKAEAGEVKEGAGEVVEVGARAGVKEGAGEVVEERAGAGVKACRCPPQSP